MKQSIRRLQYGQGMTEYIIIVAMIAIAQELSGNDGTAAKGNAQTAATSAQTVGNTKNTLDDYVNQKGK